MTEQNKDQTSLLDFSLLTGSERKKKAFEKLIEGYPITFDIQSPWIPEIQAEENAAVAAYSAEYGANLLGTAVVKIDAGFYIDCLQGFPGPYVAYAAKQIGIKRFFEMLKNESTLFTARIKNVVAYCEPGKKPVIFESVCEGEIVRTLEDGDGSFIDQLFIPHHSVNPERKTLGQIREANYDHALQVWGDAEEQFAKWYCER